MGVRGLVRVRGGRLGLCEEEVVKRIVKWVGMVGSGWCTCKRGGSR